MIVMTSREGPENPEKESQRTDNDGAENVDGQCDPTETWLAGRANRHRIGEVVREYRDQTGLR